MKHYLEIVDRVLTTGQRVSTRTKIDAFSTLGVIFQHDMDDGFPLLTTKKVHFHSIKVELEFFIQGHTSKKWLQDRNCHIWDQWANPQKIPPTSSDQVRRDAQLAEDDLGPIYGSQWRNFTTPSREEDTEAPSVDQLKMLVDEIEKDPDSRRLIVTAWNPLARTQMALPPCHVLFQINVRNKKLNLTWYQRSCDLMLGIPFNIASYALLLQLLAKHTDLTPGILIGMWNDVHIYENHINGAKIQLQRSPTKLPSISTTNFTSLFNWKHTDSTLLNYHPQAGIRFPIAV